MFSLVVGLKTTNLCQLKWD